VDIILDQGILAGDVTDSDASPYICVWLDSFPDWVEGETVLSLLPHGLGMRNITNCDVKENTAFNWSISRPYQELLV